MSKKLVNRSKFCPIGINSSTKTIQSTFVKLCLHHQKKGSDGPQIGKEAYSLLYKDACAECPAAKRIRKGEDPKTVVSDVIWFSDEELRAILLNKTKVTVKEVHTVINKTQQLIESVKNMPVEVNERVVRIKRLLSEMSIEVEALAKELVVSDTTVDTKLGSCASETQIPGMTKERVEFAKKLYDEEQAGATRKELSDKYAKSSKYISALVCAYTKSLK